MKNETAVNVSSPLEYALRLHEQNYCNLRKILEIAGGSLDVLLQQSLADALRSFAQNGIAITVTKER